MKRISRAASLLQNNPRLFLKYLCCAIRIYIPLFRVGKYKNINGVMFDIDPDFDPVIKSMFFGCYEMETTEVMKGALKKGDIFIDVGANIGYFSAIGASLVGKIGQVHSFEPVPQYFQRLGKMASMNSGYRIMTNQCALGEESCKAKVDITSRQNIGWNTMVPGLMNHALRKESIEVPVIRLDQYIEEKGLGEIALIKIDVEGFEFPVLKGLSNYLASADSLPVIICEIVPSAYSLLGCTLIQLSEYMKNYGYDAFSIVALHTKVDITSLNENTLVVFRKAQSLAVK